MIFSFSPCYAADSSGDNKNHIDSVKQFWQATVDWFNSDIKPWVDKNITPGAKENARQTIKQLIGNIPETFKSLMDKIGQIFK